MSAAPLDLVVVGAGVMGAAVAAEAAVRGRRVLLAEAVSAGHAGGSSHGRSRILRLAYADADDVRLCRAAYPAWAQVEERAARRLVRRTGGLDVGWRGTPSLARTAAALREAAVPFGELDGSGLRAAFPELRLAGDVVGLYQEDAAVLDADACVDALVSVARAHGADVREGAAATDIRPDADGVALRVGADTVRARHVVLAAGSWLGPLAATLGLSLPLRVTGEQATYFRPPGRRFAQGAFPILMWHRPDGRFAAAFPETGADGVKVLIESRTAPPADEADPARVAEVVALARDLLPGLGAALRTETCRYTITPDDRFIVDRHPAHPRIVLLSACSGHGFKFAPLLAGAVADLVDGREPPAWLHGFRLDRPALAPS